MNDRFARLADTNKTLNWLVQSISTLAKSTRRCSLSVIWSDEGHKDDLALRDAVSLFNALALPHCFMGIDGLGYIHVTIVNASVGDHVPTLVRCHSDYIWHYNSLAHTLVNVFGHTTYASAIVHSDFGWTSTLVHEEGTC